MRRYWPALIAGLFCATCASGLTLLALSLFRRQVATLSHVDSGTLGQLGMALAGRSGFAFVGTYCLGWAAARAITDLRRDLFAAFLRAPIEFHDRNWSANLVSTLTSDAAFIQEALGSLLPTLALHLPTASVAFVLLFVENWRLATWLTFAGLPLALWTLLTGRTLRGLSRQGQATLGRMAIVAQESFLGLRLIKALTRETLFAERFTRLTEEHFALKRRRALRLALLEGILPLAGGVALLGALWLARRQLADVRTTPPQLAAFATYLAVLAVSATVLLRAATTLEHVIGAAQRIAELRGAAAGDDVRGQRAIRCGPGAVSFEGVTFEYAEGGGGVRDLWLRLAPGEVVAIVGPNGAGKSTLLHLLLGLYRPQRGCIRLDEQPIEGVDIAAWRRQFAIVTRDPAIFSMSLAENIGLGRPGASAAEVTAAARAVRLHEFIETLPDGYDAQVGEQGVRLSSGQRQRLALARVFLQDPAVIIFDEATTSLDGETEEAFAAAFDAWAGRRTVLIVSHRAVTQWPVTRVIRMEAGRIVADARAAV